MENGISSEAGPHELCRVGVALSEEKDINRLLEMIASVARRYTNAEGCTLYLCNEEKGCLDFSVVQNERLALYQAGPDRECDWPSVPLYLADALKITTMSRPTAPSPVRRSISRDVYHETGYDFRSTRAFDRAAGYRSCSMLLVPMQDKQGGLIGVLQHLNARSKADAAIIDFPEKAVGMVKTLASQASVSVVNVRLLNRLKKFTSLGVALSAEKNIHTLLEMIATMARQYTRAEGCTVYLCNEARDILEFAVIQNEKLDISLKMDGEKREWLLISLYLEDGRENHRNVSAHCVLTREIISILMFTVRMVLISVVLVSLMPSLITGRNLCSWCL